MMPFALPNSARTAGQRLLPLALKVVHAVLVVAILWVLAQMTWSLFTPKPVAVTAGRTPGDLDAANTITSAHLFGKFEAAGSVEAVAPVNIVVRGLIAGQRTQKPVAIVVVADRPPQTVTEGAEIAPGVKLDKVYSNRIDVVSANGKQTIALTK